MTNQNYDYPIQEAILEFGINPNDKLDVEKLNDFDSNIIENYPLKKEIRFSKGIINLDKNVPKFGSEGTNIEGFLSMSKNKDKVFKSTIKSFSFHKLKPYTRWEPFIEEFKYIWENYKKIALPKNITRIGLRYVNNIEISANKICLPDYFNTKIEIAEDIPQDIIDLFLRIVIPIEDIENSCAILTQAFKPNKKNDKKLSFIFDIDITCKQTIQTESNTIWDLISELRKKANYIFDKSITEKTRRLYSGLCNGDSPL